MDTQTTATAPAVATSLPIGTPVIVRTYSAGVHFGEYQGHIGRNVILTNSRRLWFWKAKESISLSAVATHGLNTDGSKIAPVLPRIELLDAIEIIPTTEAATASIKDAPVASAR